MDVQNGSAPTIVIFGASGDLTQRKLIPALYNLSRKRRIAPGTRIVGYARTDYDRDAFRHHIREGVEQFAGGFDAEAWTSFAGNLHYSLGRPD